MNQSKEEFKASIDERLKAYNNGERAKKVDWNDVRKQMNGEKK